MSDQQPDVFEGLRPTDIEAVAQVEQQLEKQVAKKRRGRPRKIKTDEDLQMAQEMLAEMQISEDNVKRCKELYDHAYK